MTNKSVFEKIKLGMTMATYGNGAFADYNSITNSVMDAKRIVSGKNWRIGVITNSLLRFEWSDTGIFEDHPTQVVVNRNIDDDITINVSERDGWIILDTGELHVVYNQQRFSKEGLSVVVKHLTSSQFNTWHYGDAAPGNLRGTRRTLDTIDGRADIEEGILSRDGWAIVDDSRSNIVAYEGASPQQVFGKENINAGGWRVNTRENKEEDFYFFGYAHNYKQAIRDFYKLTGPQPLLPRWAMGNWWSRFYAYTQEDYLNLHDRFKSEGIPFTTAVIDMDWHITDIDPKYGYGWTGYTWNDKLFPDHAQFLTDLAQRGLHPTVNDHPRDGIRGYEKPYAEVARKVGIDPETDETVEFDITNPRFVDAYFDMHHELEDEGSGIDFWWLDWQQGGVTRQSGLDPLWILNHMHYIDSARNGKWPLTFSRYAGPGSHRYPVGFSGDTIVSWESLRFQPEFTATASNIGFGWWSHDIGGHMMGYRDDELEARWYQFGTFSPINRLHSSNSAFTSKEPWNFRPEIRSVMVDTLQLRHRLIPYIYTMNYRAHVEGEPLIQPMYWNNPDNGDAYSMPNEFWFGTELVVSPITSPSNKDVARAKADVWLPQGEWFDFFTGRRYIAEENGRKFEVWRDLETLPVFAHEGAIIPLAQLGTGQEINSTVNPENLEVVLFPSLNGQTHTFTLIEDDGVYADAREGKNARTEMSWDGSHLTISAVEGEAHAIPEQRTWTVTLRGVGDLGKDALSGAQVISYTYDEETMSASYMLELCATTADVSVEISGAQPAENPVAEDTRKMLLNAQIAYNMKEVAYRVALSGDVKQLASLGAHDFSFEYGLHGQTPEHTVTDRIPASIESAIKEIMLRS